jgi:hypothetical protein
MILQYCLFILLMKVRRSQTRNRTQDSHLIITILYQKYVFQGVQCILGQFCRH